MSEDFVDVTWRGLEVVRKAKLRGKDAKTAYLEHGTPMPTGSELVIRTAEGLELAAVVARVQEQIGGRTDSPGMEVTIDATGAAATWWLTRIESQARSVRAAARDTLIMTRGPDTIPELAVAPITAVIETSRMPALSDAALAQLAAEAAAREAVPAVVADAPAVEAEAVEATEIATPPARTTLPMPTVAEPRDDGEAVPTGIDESNDAEGLVDDGKRTMVMAAVDLEAIVAAANQPTPPEDQTGNGDKKKVARGKRTKRR